MYSKKTGLCGKATGIKKMLKKNYLINVIKTP